MSIPYQLELPDALHQRLSQLEESKQHLINTMLLNTLESYVDLAWDGETSDEEIKAGFLEGWHEAMTGEIENSIWDLIRELDDQAT